mmetsp:Transcript_11841/g.35677  ORF Transcript_11841/g.35677 Transcript_11841/m.35677 type:complete len:251 (-) Transcript_11841:2951-3703(-)
MTSRKDDRKHQMSFIHTTASPIKTSLLSSAIDPLRTPATRTPSSLKCPSGSSFNMIPNWRPGSRSKCTTRSAGSARALPGDALRTRSKRTWRCSINISCRSPTCLCASASSCFNFTCCARYCFVTMSCRSFAAASSSSFSSATRRSSWFLHVLYSRRRSFSSFLVCAASSTFFIRARWRNLISSSFCPIFSTASSGHWSILGSGARGAAAAAARCVSFGELPSASTMPRDPRVRLRTDARSHEHHADCSS